MNAPAGYSIKREITDVPEEVEAAGPPRVPVFDGPTYSLRLVDPDGGDPEMLSDWFNRPHLVEAWEQPWSASRWRDDSSYRLAGDYSRPCILSYQGVAAAYVEFYRAARDEIARIYDWDAHDTGFHMGTADTKMLGRGVMAEWIRQLPPQVFAAEAECRRMMGEPSVTNVPINKVMVRCGWTTMGVYDIRPDRRITLYRFDRPGPTD